MNSRINRRDFAKSSVAVVGTVMAASFPLSASAFHGVDDTIKIGLIGCGGRGSGAAMQALKAHPNTKLVAMADAFQDRLDGALKGLTDPKAADWSGVPGGQAAKINVPKDHQFVGFDAYKQVFPLVDVVILATPPGFRPYHFEAAVAAGKHIFMEKPVATDAPGIRKVLAAAEQAKAKKLNVVVGLQRHYQGVYRDWIGRIQDGAIGDIVMSKVYWNQGALWMNERKPSMTEMEYQMRNWYYFNWLCGDHIVEQHVHNIDVANWAKNAFPATASGMGGRQVRTGKEFGEIYDHHFVEFVYPDGSTMISQCRQQNDVNNNVSEGFWGTKGSAPWPGEIKNLKGEVIHKYAGRDDNPYQVEHDELFAAIAKGEYKFADAVPAAKSTLTGIMGRMATYSGQLIKWDDALNSNINLFPDRLAWDADPKPMPDANGFYKIPMPGITVAV